MEMVGPKKRMVAGVIFQMFFTFGFILTAGFAFYLREWRTLQIALTLPGIAFFTYWWYVLIFFHNHLLNNKNTIF